MLCIDRGLLLLENSFSFSTVELTLVYLILKIYGRCKLLLFINFEIHFTLKILELLKN
ncbi:hypothetical protein LEP1GSC137_0277 [Leptospira borgpetersenii str. Noumea 25]|nr:hypothetical protein LEP1GSC137_0277 [Leptospira borgpetersenii str. Noumea 25]